MAEHNPSQEIFWAVLDLLLSTFNAVNAGGHILHSCAAWEIVPTPVHPELEGNDWHLPELELALVTHGIANNFLSLGMLSLYIKPPKAPIPRVGRNPELKLTSHLSDSACRFIRLTPAVSPASTLLLTTMYELLAVKAASVARALQDISIGSGWGEM